MSEFYNTDNEYVDNIESDSNCNLSVDLKQNLVEARDIEELELFEYKDAYIQAPKSFINDVDDDASFFEKVDSLSLDDLNDERKILIDMGLLDE